MQALTGFSRCYLQLRLRANPLECRWPNSLYRRAALGECGRGRNAGAVQSANLVTADTSDPRQVVIVSPLLVADILPAADAAVIDLVRIGDRKSTRLNSSHT